MAERLRVGDGIWHLDADPEFEIKDGVAYIYLSSGGREFSFSSSPASLLRGGINARKAYDRWEAEDRSARPIRRR